jgi:hypothetical protein
MSDDLLMATDYLNQNVSTKAEVEEDETFDPPESATMAALLETMQLSAAASEETVPGNMAAPK